jgi:hypothetical protein
VLLSGKTLRHVLVIGVDGVRFDLLGPEVTPVIWGFGSLGFLGPVPVDETTPTWSGPCWATIATGTGAGASPRSRRPGRRRPGPASSPATRR